MNDQYDDPAMQRECEIGLLDGKNGISQAGHSPHRHAYLSGWQDGDVIWQKNIKADRIKNLAKARAVKT